jgi:hypothetical protein
MQKEKVHKMSAGFFSDRQASMKWQVSGVYACLYYRQLIVKRNTALFIHASLKLVLLWTE